MDCGFYHCTRQASIKLMFTSGMSGRYCEAHAKSFDASTIEEKEIIEANKLERRIKMEQQTMTALQTEAYALIKAAQGVGAADMWLASQRATANAYRLATDRPEPLLKLQEESLASWLAEVRQAAATQTPTVEQEIEGLQDRAW